jgi:hypothetical protein
LKINVHYLFKELYTQKYVKHITVLLDLCHQITSASKKLEDLHLAWAMVLSLLKMPSWELVKIPLFELTTLMSEAVSTRLLQKANCQKHKKSGAETAMIVYRKLSKGKGKLKSKGAQSTDKCHHCRKAGHWAKDCEEPELNKKKGGSGSAYLAVSDIQDLGTYEVSCVYMV